jgi:hypothetical protein
VVSVPDHRHPSWSALKALPGGADADDQASDQAGRERSRRRMTRYLLGVRCGTWAGRALLAFWAAAITVILGSAAARQINDIIRRRNNTP